MQNTTKQLVRPRHKLKSEIDGEAKAKIRREEGTAEADVIRVRGMAEADIIRESGKAEAESRKLLAEAMEKHGDVIIIEQLFKCSQSSLKKLRSHLTISIRLKLSILETVKGFLPLEKASQERWSICRNH